MYDEILQQASEFDAKFKTYRNPFSLMDVARDINAPHEDNHKRTPMTEKLIKEFIEYGDPFTINKQTVQYLHYKLFSKELSEPGINAGYWRNHNVKVGRHIPPDHIHVDYLMECFFKEAHIAHTAQFNALSGRLRFRYHHYMSVTQMYRVFQTIHPFADGNGRVGGILLAVASYNMLKGNTIENIIVPCQ